MPPELEAFSVASKEELGRAKPGKCAGSDRPTTEALHAWPDPTIQRLAVFLELIHNRLAPWAEAWVKARCVLLPRAHSWGKFQDLRKTYVASGNQDLYSRLLMRLFRTWIRPREEWSLGFGAGYQPSELTICVLGVLGKGG